MKNRTILSSLAVIAAALALVILPKSSHALTLIPPTLEYDVQPGQTIEPKIKLFNEEKDAISVFASTANFTAKGEEGNPNFQFEDKPTDLASWIQFPQGAITVQPGQRIEVPVTITIPTDADPGGHYASLFFGTSPSLKAKEGGQVTVQSLIGTLFIVRVEGEVREQATIKQFSTTSGKTSFNRLPVEFEIRIENSGNVHIRPQGTVVIKNLFGGETARLTINDINGAVLPNSIRKFTVNWHKADTKAGGTNFLSEIGSEWRNFAFGPYTATATITYGQKNLTAQSTMHLNVIPWRVMTLSVIIIVLIILFLTMGVRGYNRAIITKAQATRPAPPKTPAAGK